MTFRQEVKRIIIKSQNRSGGFEAMLDRIEDVHKHHRNLEVQAKIASGTITNSTKLGDMLRRFRNDR